MLCAADERLYDSKRSGRDRVTSARFDPAAGPSRVTPLRLDRPLAAG
jgi:hypothetical protein